MKKLILMCLIAWLAAGCTMNIRRTSIEFDAGRDLKVDAQGATNNTDTGQSASTDAKDILEAAQTALDQKTSSVVDIIKNAIAGQDTPADVIVPPVAADIEEIE